MKRTRLWSGTIALLVGLAWVGPATAGDPNGDFMVRVLGAVVDPDTNVNSLTFNGAAADGADADVDTEVIPAATLTYSSTRTWLWNCSAVSPILESKAKARCQGLASLGQVGSFPPS